MFTQISWATYTIIVAVLLAGYYFFIAFRYYRNDLLQLLSGKKMDTDKVSFAAKQNLLKENSKKSFEQNLFPLVQSASDEIQAFLHEGSKNKLSEDDVMNGLRKLIGKYAELKNSSFSERIENLIITECEVNFSTQVDAEQIKALWM